MRKGTFGIIGLGKMGGRVGVPSDIAKAAVWLASDGSDYLHGTTLFIDGGMTLYPGFSTNR